MNAPTIFCLKSKNNGRLTYKSAVGWLEYGFRRYVCFCKFKQIT